MSKAIDKINAEAWGIDVQCVNCKVYDENTYHPSTLSVCDGCFGSKTHPNFREKVKP